MITLIIISLLITTVYLGYTIRLFGVLWSISESYYLLEQKKKGLGILFTAWAWFAALPLLIAWLDLAEDTSQFLAFFACAALMFVGAAAQFKEQLTNAVHYGAAGVCVASALAWVLLVGYWYIPVATFAICMPVACRDKKWVFWIEIAALSATYMSLLFHLNYI